MNLLNKSHFTSKLFTLTFLIVVLLTSAVLAASLKGSPTINQRETSPFGTRKSTNSVHLAVDYGGINAGVGGDQVYSTISGTVKESRFQNNPKTDNGWGHTVLIESTSGNYRVRYSHLQNPGLGIGTTVNAGMTVGLMGNTGRLKGEPYPVHLDYAVYVKNPDTGEFQAIDPNKAQGYDLDNAADRAMLIADAKTKTNGQLRNEAAPVTTPGFTSDTTGGSSVAIIGCDPAIMEKVKARNDAVRQVSIEAAKSIITEPADIAMMSCLDQTHALLNASGGVFSNPGGDISATLGPLAQQPYMQEVNNFMGGVSAQLNAANNAFTQVTSNITKSFVDALGLGGGSGTSVPSTNCGVASQVFNLEKCLQIPSILSVSEMLDQQIARAAGILDPNQPTRSLEQICSAANSQIGGIMGNIQNQINAPFEKAADSLLSPIERNVNQIQNAPNQLF